MLPPHISSILSLRASDQVWPKCNVQPALGDSRSKFLSAAINSSILAHQKTTSESTFPILRGPLSHRCVPKSIKSFAPAKKKKNKNQETKGGAGEAACPHVCHCPSVPWGVIDPYGPFAHIPSRHPGNVEVLCSCLTAWPLMFPSRGGGSLLLSPRRRGNQMKRHDKPGWKAAPPFVSRARPRASEDARINIHFQRLAVWELVSR